jgi:hypothetical protein
MNMDNGSFVFGKSAEGVWENIVKQREGWERTG